MTFKNGYSQEWELTVDMESCDDPAEPCELLVINKKDGREVSSIDIMPLMPVEALEIIVKEYEEDNGIDWANEWADKYYDDIHVEYDR